MHVRLPRVPNMENAKPGTWWVCFGSGKYVGKVWINLICPKCAHGMSLVRGGEGHSVALDGTVSPSVVCPYTGCGWHVFVRLEGFQSTA